MALMFPAPGAQVSEIVIESRAVAQPQNGFEGAGFEARDTEIAAMTKSVRIFEFR